INGIRQTFFIGDAVLMRAAPGEPAIDRAKVWKNCQSERPSHHQWLANIHFDQEFWAPHAARGIKAGPNSTYTYHFGNQVLYDECRNPEIQIPRWRRRCRSTLQSESGCRLCCGGRGTA